MSQGTSISFPKTGLAHDTLPVNAALVPSLPLVARAADDASASSVCCADSVVVQLSATVTVRHFQQFYDGSPDSFSPSYTALDDGSLVTPPLLEDIKAAAVKFAVIAGLTMFFFMNTLRAAHYLHRGRVKNRTLFYLLLSSQTLGLIATILMIVPFFNSAVSCIVIAHVTRIMVVTSYAMLITGILGFKAFRCLNNSRIILVTLLGIRVSIFTTLALDLSRLQSRRRLSVGCRIYPEPKYLPILVTLQFVESLFICACFLVAVRRASRRPIDHGRLTIEPTLDLKQCSNHPSSSALHRQPCRGWWDYEPSQHSPCTKGSCSNHESKQQFAPVEKSPHEPRPTANAVTSSPSYRSSVVSRLSKYMPRITLFKQLVQDELLHTALITALLLATAVLMLVGTTCRVALEPPAWIALNWTITSMFTMHSFGRVVRRHEQDAVLLHPTSWDLIHRVQVGGAKALREGGTQHAVSRRPNIWEEGGENSSYGTRSILIKPAETVPFPQTLRPSYASYVSSGERSPAPFPGHTPDCYQPSVVLPQASPTSGEYPSSSPSAESSGSLSSEAHIVRPATTLTYEPSTGWSHSP